MSPSQRALIKGTGEQPCGDRAWLTTMQPSPPCPWAHLQVERWLKAVRKFPGIQQCTRKTQVTLLVLRILAGRTIGLRGHFFFNGAGRPGSSALGCCLHNQPSHPAGLAVLLSPLCLDTKSRGQYPCHSSWWAPSQACGSRNERAGDVGPSPEKWEQRALCLFFPTFLGSRPVSRAFEPLNLLPVVLR